METIGGIKETGGFVIDLSYDDDSSLLYTIPAFFGSNRQGGKDSKFVIDTSTPFVTITDKGCDNCSDTRKGEGIFDTKGSISFAYKTKPDEAENLTIGDIEVVGYWGSDLIGL